MKFLSKQEAELWCHQNKIVLSDSGLPQRPDATEKFDIPTDAQHRVALVAQKMSALKSSPQILVWFHDWNVWPSGQRMHIFDRFRASYGETRPVSQSPGHIFDNREFDDAVSFVTLAVLFLWDCYVVTPKSNKLLFFSHDEYGLAKGIEVP